MTDAHKIHVVAEPQTRHACLKNPGLVSEFSTLEPFHYIQADTAGNLWQVHRLQKLCGLSYLANIRFLQLARRRLCASRVQHQ
jgi:hypothetical protein